MKFAAIWDHLDERNRWLMAASEATSLGYGEKLRKEKMELVNRDRHKFHHDWNYVIEPTSDL